MSHPAREPARRRRSKRRLPTTRAGCPIERPCPFAGCRYHLGLDVTEHGGVHFNVAGRGRYARLPVLGQARSWRRAGEPMGRFVEALLASRETCALDVAGEHPDGLTHAAIAELLATTDESIRRVEMSALAKLRAGLEAAGIDPALFPDALLNPEGDGDA